MAKLEIRFLVGIKLSSFLCKLFFELYNAFEDVAEDMEADDIDDGFLGEMREQGRDFVRDVMREHAMDEERSRRILKKAFALRFRVAYPEFDL